MSRLRSPTAHIRFTLLLAVLSACLVCSIIVFPEQSFDASLHSLTVWWTIVFPALLPFLIIAEMLLAYGLFHFIGTLLEPMMRLFFGLPGTSGPVMTIGFTIGYPSGAKLTHKLKQQHDLTHSEGNLLLSLSHMASPILMINVIAVGFFHNAPLGFALTIVQILSLIGTGIVLRFFALPNQLQQQQPYPDEQHSGQVQERAQGRVQERVQRLGQGRVQEIDKPLLQRATIAMRQARFADGRSFGKLLGDTVSTSIQTLMMIGGFMMIFAVIIQVLQLTMLSQLTSTAMNTSLLKGFFEIHVGSFALSEVHQAGLLWQFAAISGILAWSGLALHAQVISIIHKSGLRYSFFILARTIHACLAIIAAIVLWSPLQHFIHSPLMNRIIPSFQMDQHSEQLIANTCSPLCHLTLLWTQSTLLIVGILCVLIALSIPIFLIKKIARRKKSC